MNSYQATVACLILQVFAKCGGISYPKTCDPNYSVSLLSWNLLAPTFVNRDMYNGAVIDHQLFNEERRLNIIRHRLYHNDADLILLQELQDDWRMTIQETLDMHSLAVYAAHRPENWRQAKKPVTAYRKNGIAIYYRRDKLKLLDVRSVETTSTGNIISLATFHQLSDRKALTPSIIVVNCQLEQGSFFSQSLIRVKQMNIVKTEIDRLKSQLRQRYSGNLIPQVIWAGDFNTLPGLIAYSKMTDLGFESVFDVLGEPTPNNFYSSYLLPHTVSYVFVETISVMTEKINVVMSSVDDVVDRRTDEQILKDAFNGLNYFFEDLARNGNFNASELATLYQEFEGQVTYTNPLNIALRKGSDQTYQQALFCFGPRALNQK